MSVHLRPVSKNDHETVTEIYNQAIRRKGETADLDEVSAEGRAAWFAEHAEPRYPILVAEKEGKIVGWSSISPYRKGRRALSGTAEISIYLDEVFMSKGLGSAMLDQTIAQAKEIGFQHLIAIIIGDNARSLALFEKFGFSVWGRLPGVVHIDENTIDHVYLGKTL